MDAIVHADVIRNEDFAAMLYESGNKLLHIHRFGKTESEHVQSLLNLIMPNYGSSIIDMGCGFGELARLMHEKRPDLNITLLNLSLPQLRYASDEFEKIHGNFHSVNKPDGEYDVVMFCFSIGHANIELAMKESSRLLKPGGTLFVYDMSRESGDNKQMEDLVSYRVHSPEVMFNFAVKAGFVQNMSIRPEADNSVGHEVAGYQYEAIFGGTIPHIWRFIKN